MCLSAWLPSGPASALLIAAPGDWHGPLPPIGSMLSTVREEVREEETVEARGSTREEGIKS